MSKTIVLVEDPKKFHKEENYNRALAMCKAFLDLNGIAYPDYNVGHLDEMDGEVWGLYEPEPKKITVDVHQCRELGDNPDKSGWMFSGGKSDATPAGTVAHETGHHVHFSRDVKAMIKDLRGVIDKEIRVSAYEPNYFESIAEMMRIFILNPDLLKKGRPLRYRYLSKTCGLKQLHDKSWKYVLKHAHPRIIKAHEAWIKEGTA